MDNLALWLYLYTVAMIVLCREKGGCIMEIHKHSVFSFLTLLWFVSTSLVNVLYAKEVYLSPELYETFHPNDVINLFFGSVALLLCTLKTVKTSRIFLPCRSAMLLFILYNAIASVYANTNGMDVVLLLLAIAAVLTLVETGQYQRLLGLGVATVHSKRYASLLIVISGLFILRSALQLLSKEASPGEKGVALADILLCSLWLANGIGFLRNAAKCFIAAFICYIHGSLLFLSLLLFFILQPLLLGTAFPFVDFVVIAMMSTAFFIPLALLAKEMQQLP